jgi:hypothetical protein
MAVSIGPWTFPGGTGRLQVADSGLRATVGGKYRIGKRKPRVAVLTTFEEAGSLSDGWARALSYRAAIGALAQAVTDDLGQTAPLVLIADASSEVRAVSGGAGATVVTQWSLVPPVWWGNFGVANVQQTPASPRALQSKVATAAPIPYKIGYTTWAAATGRINTPVTYSQTEEMRASSKSIGADEVVSPEGLFAAGGDLETVTTVATADEASRLGVLCRRHVGRVVYLSVAGVALPPAAVSDVDVEVIKLTAPTSGSYAVTARWSFGFDSAGAAEDAKESLSGTVTVETAALFGQWRALEGAVCEEDEEGCGAVAGSIVIQREVGAILDTTQGAKLPFGWDSAVAINQIGVPEDVGRKRREPSSVLGHWVRLVIRNGSTPNPVWWGRVHAVNVSGGPNGSVETIHASEIISAFQTLHLYRWYELGRKYGEVCDPGEVLPFNTLADGDMAQPSQPVGATEVQVHGRGAESPRPRRWRGAEILQTLVAAYNHQYPAAPKLVLSGQFASLADVDAHNLDGRPFAEMLAQIVSPNIGFSFRLEPKVVGGVEKHFELRVFSTVAADISLPDGSVPANDRIFQNFSLAPTTDGASRCLSFDAQTSSGAQADTLYVQAEKPWAAVALAASTTRSGTQYGLEKGWTGEEETAWDAATGEARNVGGLAKVWRRFVVSSSWEGYTWEGEATAVAGRDAVPGGPYLMLTARARSGRGDGLFGDFGETGKLIAGTAVNDRPFPRAATLTLTRGTPIYSGVDYSVAEDYGSTRARPALGDSQITVFGHNVANGIYETLSDRWQVTVADEGASFTLGTDYQDAEEVREYLTGGRSIVAVLGMELHLPWRCSWSSSTQTDLPRTVVVRVPYRPRYVPKGTPFAVSGQSTIKKSVGTSKALGPEGDWTDWETSPGSGISVLDQTLRLHRLWHGAPVTTVTTTLPGVYYGGEYNTLNDPPFAPKKNDMYRIGIGTGAWSGKDGLIATWNGAAWTYSQQSPIPSIGCYVAAWELPLSGEAKYQLVGGGLVTARRRNYAAKTTTITTTPLQLAADRQYVGAHVPAQLRGGQQGRPEGY